MQKEKMDIVFVGHVDHGKSTVVGRLLHDTGSLPEGKLESIKCMCEQNSKPFEYAFLIDALKDERSQGITIDAARVFFESKKRNYIIIDAPGHIEFLKNMITGASRAEAALLVIDANEGVQANSKRHGYMLSMLGVKQIAVLVNKMDLVNYSETRYKSIVDEYSSFLNELGVVADCFIPVSAVNGDQIASSSKQMNWFDGPTVLEALDNFKAKAPDDELPFRMPIQGIYKFTNFNDSRRIFAGVIETGKISVGEDLIFYPSGKRSTVSSIEMFNAPERTEISCGYAPGLTLKEQIYVKRGEVAVKAGEERPSCSKLFRASIFWLGQSDMVMDKSYILKLGTTKTTVRVKEILSVLDTEVLSKNEKAASLPRHCVADCILESRKPISFDINPDFTSTNRFVLVDDYEIRGGGIIQESIVDDETEKRGKVFKRNTKWLNSSVSFVDRAERYNQKPVLILVTGEKNAPRKKIARAIEEMLFQKGRIAYYLGFGSLRYGVDADLPSGEAYSEEHIRRFSEVVHIMIDAGLMLVSSAQDISAEDMQILNTSLGYEGVEGIWIGDNQKTDFPYSLSFDSGLDVSHAVDRVYAYLCEKKYLFSPLFD